MERVGETAAQSIEGSLAASPVDSCELLAPVPHPASCRDGYAFRQHVATARRNRGLEMIPEYDQFPVFYFTNHQAIQGTGEIRCMPAHLDKLDFELELAGVMNKQGRNVPESRADSYIAGYMILNDIRHRNLPTQEMKLHMEPAQGQTY